MQVDVLMDEHAHFIVRQGDTVIQSGTRGGELPLRVLHHDQLGPGCTLPVSVDRSNQAIVQDKEIIRHAHYRDGDARVFITHLSILASRCLCTRSSATKVSSSVSSSELPSGHVPTTHAGRMQMCGRGLSCIFRHCGRSAD